MVLLRMNKSLRILFVFLIIITWVVLYLPVSIFFYLLDCSIRAFWRIVNILSRKF